jgi:hypothetical protein
MSEEEVFFRKGEFVAGESKQLPNLIPEIFD